MQAARLEKQEMKRCMSKLHKEVDIVVKKHDEETSEKVSKNVLSKLLSKWPSFFRMMREMEALPGTIDALEWHLPDYLDVTTGDFLRLALAPAKEVNATDKTILTSMKITQLLDVAQYLEYFEIVKITLNTVKHEASNLIPIILEMLQRYYYPQQSYMELDLKQNASLGLNCMISFLARESYHNTREIQEILNINRPQGCIHTHWYTLKETEAILQDLSLIEESQTRTDC